MCDSGVTPQRIVGLPERRLPGCVSSHREMVCGCLSVRFWCVFPCLLFSPGDPLLPVLLIQVSKKQVQSRQEEAAHCS